MENKVVTENTSSPIDQVLSRMKTYGDRSALYWNGTTLTYSDFLDLVDSWVNKLGEDGVGAGHVCGVFGDYSPQTCALMFALMRVKAITVPFTREVKIEMPGFMKIAGVESLYRFEKDDTWTFEKIDVDEKAELIETFKTKQKPGLIVFTSGSTGKPKGILQDCEAVMNKFVEERKGWKTVLFLLMDHFGGYNTFLSSFAYGGMAVCMTDRSPDGVSKAISDSKANLLPTTPTFLNLIIAGRYYQKYDFSSIELISYGTEMMADETLKKIAEIFPNAKLKQTYGMSELGVLRSKSKSKDSLWVKIGGTNFKTKIVDNILWVKSEANMVGYLNAPQPFDKDGWMCTGDEVEVDGDYVRFKGRKSEVINVGGKKVFPTEIENVILAAGNIKDVTVLSKQHPLMGQVPHARVTTIEDENPRELTERLRKHCNERLAKYKVPLRFVATAADEKHHNLRFKKSRIERG